MGADFHRAMVATAPGEKLVRGRRIVRNWTQLQFLLFFSVNSSLFLCRKLHLFLGKSTKTAATRAALFDTNMYQIVCLLALRPRPHWGSLQRSPRPLAVFRGTTSKGRGRERRDGEGKGEQGRREEMKGK